MRRCLHLLTRPTDSLVDQILSRQKEIPDTEVIVIDLTVPGVDYIEVVRLVFECESVATW